MGQPRVAFLILNHAVVGGVQQVTSSILKLLDQQGVYVTDILSMHTTSKVSKIPYPDTVTIHPLGITKNNPLAKVLPVFVAENKIDTLVFQGDNMTIALQILQALKATPCKAILHYHGSCYAYLKKYVYSTDIVENPVFIGKKIWNALQYPFKKQKLKKVLTLAKDGFVCVSKGAEKELRDLFPKQTKNHNKLTTIYNPLTFGLPTDITSFLAQKKKQVIYISRLERKHKNTMLLLRAWQKIAAKYPDWELLILGSGTIGDKMKKYVADHKITGVVFTGMVSNVDAYVKQSAIATLTSDCEGYNTALLEATSFGNAIVSTKSNGGITDLITPDVSGFLVPRNNATAFAQKLEVLMQDKALRERFAKAAFAYIQTDFAPEKIAAQWQKIL